MRFATKIVVVQSLLVLVAGAVCAVMVTALQSSREASREISQSYEQTIAVMDIARGADDYSEQIAELFILIETEPEEVDVAHDALLAAIETMEREVAEEMLDLEADGNESELAAEQAELDRMIAIRTTVERMEEARLRMLDALREGRHDAAVDIFRDEIESGFDSALGTLAADSVAREREEVVEALEEAGAAAGRLQAIAWLLAIASVAGAAALSLFLNRSVLRPVAALARGAEAVTAGDLSHRVPAARLDELGDLARAFNRMTAEVDTKRLALENAKDDLEWEVAERTAELREAVAELEAQSESRARFLADISHELRTPLTIVRGKAEVTLRDPSADARTMRAALDRIALKAEQMGRLVEDLLFLARSEAGAIPIQRSPVVMQEVVADALLDSRDLFERKGVRFESRQPGDPVTVHGDADRLRQAVLIPLDNAAQTAPEGSAVHVTLERAGEAARLTVTDEGEGFDAEAIARAPRRFYRGRANGTGIGLSIAHWIMEGHGGTLRLSNGDAGGAVVRLELPLAATAPESSGSEKTA